MARQAKEDINKLPKWAQDKIYNLVREIENLSVKYQSLLNDFPKSNIYTYSPGDHLDKQKVYLDDKGTFHFKIDNLTGRNVIRFRLSKDYGGSVYVNSDRRLVISPFASNSIYLGMEGD